MNNQQPVTAPALATAPENRALEPKRIEEPDSLFLNAARRDRVPLAITLRDGRGVTGLVISFGRYSLLLETADHRRSIIYKTAIAQIATVARPAAPAARPGSLVRPVADKG